MVFFPHSIIEVYNEVTDEDICGIDNYGIAKSCEVYLGSTIADFQELTQGELRRDYGGQVNGAARIYVPYECEISITPTCKVRVDGDTRTWQVSGYPIIRNALIPHIEIGVVLEG